MRLNQLPPTYRGHGTKIALLDSGVGSSHPDLKSAVSTGYDFTTGSERTWNADTTGHGTWCTGVTAAAATPPASSAPPRRPNCPPASSTPAAASATCCAPWPTAPPMTSTSPTLRTAGQDTGL
ncbi:hypothetical protein DIZ27_36010 [Streptomyces sp. NWU339]|uniref:S8 family serine peptidase n=1 Tax=Streptomyces sp. NWU339 TaxID=2185284 RepID=UPI000D682F99|nr:S8 family serine peptidase [Streptomyces sp. NWU339]PWI05968.1 hypothetical protein DIZ27_36010 [Streptomyces sp. NWU339]